MSLTHPNCMHTFYHDTIVITEPSSATAYLLEAKHPVRVMLPLPKKEDFLTVVRQVVKQINVIFKDLLFLEPSDDTDERFSWTFKHADKAACVILSPTLKRDIFCRWSDVVTPYDTQSANYHAIASCHEFPTDPNDFYIIWVPYSYPCQTVRLKAENEEITVDTLVERFNARVPSHIAILERSGGHLIVHKQANHSNTVLLYSKALLRVLNFRHGGVYAKEEQRYFAYTFSDGFKPEWFVQLITVPLPPPYWPRVSRNIVLPPATFSFEKDAIAFVQSHIRDDRVHLSCDRQLRLSLTLTDEHLSFSFDNTLRDMFAFDRNVYEGKGTFTASDVVSLSRRIQYLFVYSNIITHIPVGDTEAPLLAVVPFNKKSCKPYHEHLFKYPMYVPLVHNRFAHIEIEIRDDAGELAPFPMDSVTSLQLHFRPRQS